MMKTRQTVATLILAMTLAPWAGSVLAADDGPVVNDYSNMGAEYNASPDDKSSDSKNKSDSESASADSDSAKQTAESGGADGKPYEVNCEGNDCKVNGDVMVGYEKFGSHCSQCHAQNAEGSTFAPSLVKRLQGMDQGRFTAAVAGGVTRLDSTTGQYSVMPAWSNNEDVMNHVQQIWAFLKARSDGALPAGRPEPMDSKS